MAQLLAFLQVIQILGRWAWFVFYVLPIGTISVMILDIMMWIAGEPFLSNSSRLIFGLLLAVRWVQYKKLNKIQSSPTISIENNNFNELLLYKSPKRK